MFKKILLACTLTIASASVMALPIITGQFDFAGGADITRDSVTNEYTGIDYIGDPVVMIANGTFGVLNAFIDAPATADTVTMVDPWNVTAPTVALWSVGGFSFDLDAITLNDGTTVAGTGIIKFAGYEDTFGSWSFTSQSIGNGRFSFSSTTVPAPGAFLLLGLGLVGLGFSKRVKKA